jgi:hypothetical protein
VGDNGSATQEDHPDTLKSMANLAFTWQSSAHDAEAINLLEIA